MRGIKSYGKCKRLLKTLENYEKVLKTVEVTCARRAWNL